MSHSDKTENLNISIKEARMGKYGKIDQETIFMIAKYEERLRNGDTSPFPKHYFVDANGRRYNANARVVNRERALALFRFVFEEILGWSPQEAANKLSADVIRRLDLSKAYKQLETDMRDAGLSANSYFYVAKMCYPDQIHAYSKTDIIILNYKAICSTTPGKGGKKFPKDFFSGTNAKFNAQTCLLYVLSTEVVFKTVKEMYEFFAVNAQAVPWLTEHRLMTPCDRFYLNPLDYLHSSLTSGQRDDFLFNYLEAGKLMDNAHISLKMEVIDEELEEGNV